MVLLAGSYVRPQGIFQGREAACVENRCALVSGPLALRPRRRDAFTQEDLGLDDNAFLQHDIHAEPILLFFMCYFASKGLKSRELPSAGIVLIVRSRFDSDVLPCDRKAICVGEGIADGGAIEFQLCNLTGEGMCGTHYDPLFPSEHVPVEVVCDQWRVCTPGWAGVTLLNSTQGAGVNLVAALSDPYRTLCSP